MKMQIKTLFQINSKSQILFASALLIASLICTDAQGATRTVSNTDDSGPGSLRDTIATADPGDEIQFSVSGVISINSTLSINKELTITGGGNVTISGPKNVLFRIDGITITRVFTISNETLVTLNGLTITNGLANQGGGINNTAILTINDCIVSGNLATASGGGIYNGSAGTLTINNSTVKNNHSGDVVVGYGINVSPFGGGITNLGQLAVNDSTISGNTTAVGGGGIYNTSSMTLSNSTISGNQAAGDDGGGISHTGQSLIVRNSTITNNSSGAGDGGGISNSGSGITSITSTIIAGNSDANGAPDAYGTYTSGGYNLIGQFTTTASTTGFTETSDQVGTAQAPLDPKLVSLANNGGSTLTHALTLTSPAIDKGSNPQSLLKDQCGNVRVSGNAADVGAFEYQTSNRPFPAPACSLTKVSGGTGDGPTVEGFRMIRDKMALRNYLGTELYRRYHGLAR